MAMGDGNSWWPRVRFVRAASRLAGAALAALATSAAASVFYHFNVAAESGIGGFVSFGTGPSINDKGKIAFVNGYSGGPSVQLWSPVGGLTDLATNFLSPNRSFGDSVRINSNDEVLTWNRLLPLGLYEVRVFRSGTPNDSSIMARGLTGVPPYDILYQNPAMNNTRVLEDRSNFILTGNKDGVCDPGEVCVSQIAFNAILLPTRYLGTVVQNPTNAADAGVRHEFGLNTSQSRPMMADDGRIVVRGVNPTDPISLFNYALGAPTTIAGSAKGFTALGAASGITPDGKVIAFAGDRGHGNGIFLSIELSPGVRRLVRIVGENATVPKSELGLDGSGNKLFLQSIELDSRVGIVYTPDVDGIPNQSVVVSFIGTPNAASRTNPGTGKPFLFSAQKGLWTIRIDLGAPLFNHICVTRAPGSGILPTPGGDDQLLAPPGAIPVITSGANDICETENDDVSETLFSRSSPIPVVQIGDTIKSSTGLHTVSALSVNDPIAQANYDSALIPRTARFGDHRVVFYAQVDAGAAQMIVGGEHLDSDQDGLLDHWETTGIDLTGSGTIDLDLPAMGANPFQRDLFLQVDWTADRPAALHAGLGLRHRPVTGMIRQLAQAFAAAPALPNGIPAGIQLHVDAGAGQDPAHQFFSRNMGLGPLVGGQTVAGGPVDILYFGMPGSVSLPGVNAVDFDTVKNALFWNHHRGAREFAFLHIVMSDFHHAWGAIGDDNVSPFHGTSTAGNGAFDLKDDGTGNVVTSAVKNYGVKITSGTGAGQIRGIVSGSTNGATGFPWLIVAPAWNVVPDATSTYTIFDSSSGEGHAHFRYDGPFANGKNLVITLTLGGPGPNNETASLFDQFETFNHEMGHLLSLMHGGVDHLNYKPTYHSVLNYAYQLCPLGATATDAAGNALAGAAACPIDNYSGAADAVSTDWRHIDSRFAHTFQTFGQAFGAVEPAVTPFQPSPHVALKTLTDHFPPADATAPVVVVATPIGGTAFAPGSAIGVTYSATDNVGVTRGEVFFDVNGDGVIDDATEIFVPTFTPPGSFSVTLPPVSGPSGSRTLTAIAYDAMGNPGILNLTVNIGTVAPVTVPAVVNLAQDAATAAITGAGLAVGNLARQISPSVAAGAVVSQNPASGLSRAPGTNIDLVISLGTNGVTVPDVLGLSQAAATTVITGAGLVVGSVTLITAPATPGVLGQTPLGQSIAAGGTAVNLLVSSTVATVNVPNVVGLTQAAATTAITGAGLALGTVTPQASATVPAGDVISQNPLAGASVASGSAVDLVVSTGPGSVTVPNVIGLTQAAASTAITGASLVLGTVTLQPSAIVPAGSVISQNPLASASAAAGSAVNLVVSAGNFTLDLDASGAATKYDPLTDGVLLIRYQLGWSGTALTSGALGATATRTDPAAIKTYLDSNVALLDIDGNGTHDALTDGLLILRYMFGLRGSSLIAGAYDPLGSRTTAPAIEAYLQSLMP